MMLRWLHRLFSKTDKVNTVPNITDPYRINRIIRSKYRANDYVVVHPVLHHYAFEIDGRQQIFGIIEVIGAMKALEEAGL